MEGARPFRQPAISPNNKRATFIEAKWAWVYDSRWVGSRGKNQAKVSDDTSEEGEVGFVNG